VQITRDIGLHDDVGVRVGGLDVVRILEQSGADRGVVVLADEKNIAGWRGPVEGAEVMLARLCPPSDRQCAALAVADGEWKGEGTCLRMRDRPSPAVLLADASHGAAASLRSISLLPSATLLSSLPGGVAMPIATRTSSQFHVSSTVHAPPRQPISRGLGGRR